MIAFRNWGVLIGMMKQSAFAVLGFSFLANMLMLSGPIFMLQIYDRVLTSGSIPTLVALSILIAVLYAAYGFLEFIRSRILVRFAGAIDMRFGGQAFEAINRNALAGKREENSGPIQDLGQVRLFLSGPGPFAFLDAPWTPAYLIVVYLMHPVLGLTGLLAALLLVAVTMLNNFITVRSSAQAHTLFTISGRMAEEARRNADVVRALGMMDGLKSKWRAIQTQGLASHVHASDRTGVLTALTRTLRLTFQSAILAVGAWLAIIQEISPGTMIAASIIVSRALAPVDQMVAHWGSFVIFRQAWFRLIGLGCDTPSASETVALADPAGDLVVRNLSVTLPGTKKPQLTHASFSLAPGDGLAIVGSAGSGKTTLARTIAGLLPTHDGVIQLDGVPLEQYTAQQLGRCIGYLPQSVELFEGTIGENISRFGQGDQSEEIVAAAALAGIHEMITRFPDGYATQIGESGHKLSAGQRQRIGLARALFGKPSMVILDEPNSNLDAEGEAALIEAIRELRAQGTTVLLVAHRPAAISVLNKALVLNGGRLISFGDREKVLVPVAVSSNAEPRVAAQAANVSAHPSQRGKSRGRPVTNAKQKRAS